MIPDGRLYMSDELGAGMVATVEQTAVNTGLAGGDINFGYAVSLKDDGTVVQATGAPIYGIALRRGYTKGYEYSNAKDDKFSAGETLSVLRDGTVAVVLAQDVKAGQEATVNTDGTFKPAGASDAVVGVFLTAGKSKGTASLQTRIQFRQATTAK